VSDSYRLFTRPSIVVDSMGHVYSSEFSARFLPYHCRYVSWNAGMAEVHSAVSDKLCHAPHLYCTSGSAPGARAIANTKSDDVIHVFSLATGHMYERLLRYEIYRARFRYSG